MLYIFACAMSRSLNKVVRRGCVVIIDSLGSVDERMFRAILDIASHVPPVSSK